MRDAESVRRIGDEIEMSRRLSASGRVTGGVAHEVKNPINAIVLHLNSCRTSWRSWIPIRAVTWILSAAKFSGSTGWCKPWWTSCAPANCIWWKWTFAVCSKKWRCLRPRTRRNTASRSGATCPDEPLPVNVDLDLIKQALLNVVLNGVQAMPQGGPLTISAHRDANAVVAEISDRGVGIHEDMHDKVFELYFTTKKDGNGIGLAQTLPDSGLASRVGRI